MFFLEMESKRVNDEIACQGLVLLRTERCLFAMDMGKHFSYVIFQWVKRSNPILLQSHW